MWEGHLVEYISSIIEAGGGIVGSVAGAFIAAGYIGKAFKANIAPQFRTYSDEKHDVHKLMRTAKNSIYIVASIGDQLLEKHEKRIWGYLKKSVRLHFLIQKKPQYYELEHYINANNDFTDEHYDLVRNSALEKLKRLQTEFPTQVEIREFPFFLSASYIGIDIEEDVATNSWLSHAIIQVMLYQYAVPSKMCPITYFSFKDNRELFKSTANCISEMWSKGEKVEA